MIEKIYRNKYMAICDNCGTGQECESWADVMDFMNYEGWKKRLVDGEWKHYCPECEVMQQCRNRCIRCGGNWHIERRIDAFPLKTIAAWNRRAEPRWIPVTERLPDCDDKWGISKIVLCLDAEGRVGFGIYQNGKKQLYHGWFTGGDVGENSVTVTHWMPLPEPPKEDCN